MKLHIGIAAPIASTDIADLLQDKPDTLPAGYTGAPFTGVIIRELLKQGHKVSAFTTDNSIYPEAEIIKLTGPNFEYYICAERPRAWRFNRRHIGRAIDTFGYERRLLTKAINSAKPEFIHAHWTYEFALAAIKTKIPHLITCHDAPAVILKFNPYPYRAMRYLMARQVYRHGKHFSTVSDYMVGAVQHYTSVPIRVVPNPLADFVLTAGRIRVKPDTKRIGLICNGWESRKNPQPALLAFAQFHKIHPEAELHLYGQGFGPNQAAEKWCQEQQITKNLFFHGSMPHKALITQLDQLDLLLHPALEESFGVVIAEAMSLGLPIVAGSNSGAVPWVVGNNETNNILCCAVLTDVSNPLTILASLNTAFDSDYQQRSAAGYNRAQKIFAPEVVCVKYLELYQQILNSITT
ncbi:glycosyltransferase family 4 protein [Methylomonas sp. AM2-LC]|uniref:glycosyltransferase family 4 protein n=1 Tax=Methylomonas sp. AM2-LC TaxID=3153301 RepID=UPI003267390B